MKKVCYCNTCDKFGFKEENDTTCLKCNSPLVVTKYAENYYEGLSYEEKMKLKECIREGKEYKEPAELLVTTLPYFSNRTIIKSEPYSGMVKDEYQKCDFGKKNKEIIENLKKEATTKGYDAILNLKIEYKDFYGAMTSGFSAGLSGFVIPQYYKIYITCEFANLSD